MGFAGQFSGMPIWNFAWGPGIRWGGGYLSSVVRWVSGVGAGRWFIAVASFEVFLIFLKIRSSYVVRVSATR